MLETLPIGISTGCVQYSLISHLALIVSTNLQDSLAAVIFLKLCKRASSAGLHLRQTHVRNCQISHILDGYAAQAIETDRGRQQKVWFHARRGGAPAYIIHLKLNHQIWMCCMSPKLQAVAYAVGLTYKRLLRMLLRTW